MAAVFSKKEKADWDAAVDFFATHKPEFKQMRDDFGGYFLERTAEHALEEMGAKTVGFLIVRAEKKADTAGPLLEFVQEIVSVSMAKHKGNREWDEYYKETLQLLLTALRHVTQQVHILTYHYLWPRFDA